MYYCYHTTKIKNLKSILQGGLKPNYGNNSSLIADRKKGKIYYSAGMEATVKMFSSFDSFFYRVQEGFMNEESFINSLSPEEYAIHKRNVDAILKSESFKDFIKDNIYLCFSPDSISDRHEEKPMDSYTSETIPPDKLKVCVIRNKTDNSIYSFSMQDIYCFLNAQNPNLENGLEIIDYLEDIKKFQNDNYYMDYLDLKQFCKLYPNLIMEDKANKKTATDDYCR